MKKVILLAAVAVMAVFSANAQAGKWYIGTSGIGDSFITNNYNFITGFATTNGNTMVGIAPEVGYNLKDNISLGLGLGVTSIGKFNGGADQGTNFGVNPYVRWYAWQKDNFSFYCQGNLRYATNDKSKIYSYGIDVNPGIAYSFNNHFGMTATIGALGWQKYKGGKGIFGLEIDGGLGFGLSYTF